MSRWKRIAKKYHSLLEAFVVLFGTIVGRELESAPLSLWYVVPIILIPLAFGLVLRVIGKKNLLDWIGGATLRFAVYFAGLTADFLVGAGFGILFLAGLLNWGGWVVFGMFFVMALIALTMKDRLTTVVGWVEKESKYHVSK